jgi:soluble lytic murein transglycosylase
MRQESIFDDQIKSPAGAIGLMQIMPYTGEALALQEQIPNFDKKMLRNPLMAIRLGIRYLKDLWDDFGDPRWVLANYNAGPGPARRWKKLGKGKEYEVQVEEVSYWETRDYIKKVMGNYWVYKALYR